MIHGYYHVICDTAFRNGQLLPKKYSSSLWDEVSPKRPTAFNHAINYLKEKDEEQLTVTDLVEIIEEHLRGTPHGAFSNKWMKERLMEWLKNDIVIFEINVVSGEVALRKRHPIFYMSSTINRNLVILVLLLS